jgi:hypothetical protein
MQYRTPIAVADTLRRLADGGASADPLHVSDAAELERIAAWVESRSELQAELRVRVERAALAAYSLGARHVLERYEALDHGNSLLKLIEECDSLKRRIAEQEAQLEATLDRERVNLGTGEITDGPRAAKLTQQTVEQWRDGAYSAKKSRGADCE